MRAWQLQLFVFSLLAFCLRGNVAWADSIFSDQFEDLRPLQVELFADPDLVGPSFAVVFDSGAFDPAGRPLTYHWDLGAGPVAGGSRLLHRFSSAGSYSVSVTVSNGRATVTDTVTVQLEPQPQHTVVLSTAGGAVSLGSITVRVPAAIAPGPFTLALTRLPSMQTAAERALGAGNIVALGEAYDIDLPLKPAVPIEVAIHDPGAIDKDPTKLAFLVRALGQPYLLANDEPVPAQSPLADYWLVPVSRVGADGTVYGQIFGRKRLQLVSLTEPLETRTFTIPAAAAAARGVESLSVVIRYMEYPPDLEAYTRAIEMSMEQVYDVLILQRKFVGPKGTITVVVGHPFSDSTKWASISTSDHHTIHLSHWHQPIVEGSLGISLAHEYFHLIQNLNNNPLSIAGYHAQNRWFKEGSADWAMDEVFDSVQGLYHTTVWWRFETPLNQVTSPDFAYQVLVFWKWAEARSEDVVRRTIEHQYQLTHSTAAGAQHLLENSVSADYLSTFRTVWPTVDFLQFITDARYAKDFDTGENRPGELWASNPPPNPHLGPAKTVYVRSAKDKFVEAGVAGDAETNPLVMDFALKQHLTGDVLRVRNIDLDGVLHVRFPVTAAALDGRVLVLDSSTGDLAESHEVRNLSVAHDDVKAGFDTDQAAIIIIVDPRWQYDAGATPIDDQIEVWVEDPCGPLPGNAIDVSTTAELVNAARTAGAGSVIRLAPGTYTPPLGSWPTPEFGPFNSNLLLRNLTLIGAGENATRIVLQGGDTDLSTYGDATIRNLTIDTRSANYSIINSLDAGDVHFCNVAMLFSSSREWGLIFAPWHGGSASLRLYDSALDGGTPSRGTGIAINDCASVPPANISVEIRDSIITGWLEGLLYEVGSFACGPIAVQADCVGFQNNRYNVAENRCSGGTCMITERCP